MKALLAFFEGRHEEALAHLDAMGGARPWFYEAPLLRGDILLARATSRWSQGERDGAQADLDAGRRAYAAAIAIAESAPAVAPRPGPAGARRARHGAVRPGQRPAPLRARPGGPLPRAHRRRPTTTAPIVLVARLHRRLAEHRATRGGEDVVPLLEKSLAAARDASRLAPPSARVPLELAVTHRQWARYLQQRGEDPREQLRLALEAFERLRPEERDYAFHANLGMLHQVWADYESEHGGEPLVHQDRAIAAYREAIHLDERQADAWINLGNAWRKRASFPGATDAEGDLGRAREALERARGLNPANVVACYQGAYVSKQLAQRSRDRGEEYGPDLEKALALYREGLALNPKLPQLHDGLGVALLWQAEQLWDDGGDPEPLLTEARRAFEQARAVAPQQAFATNNLGEVEVTRASFQLARGEDPGPSASAAVKSYRAGARAAARRCRPVGQPGPGARPAGHLEVGAGRRPGAGARPGRGGPDARARAQPPPGPRVAQPRGGTGRQGALAGPEGRGAGGGLPGGGPGLPASPGAGAREAGVPARRRPPPA